MKITCITGWPLSQRLLPWAFTAWSFSAAGAFFASSFLVALGVVCCVAGWGYSHKPLSSVLLLVSLFCLMALGRETHPVEFEQASETEVLQWITANGRGQHFYRRWIPNTRGQLCAAGRLLGKGLTSLQSGTLIVLTQRGQGPLIRSGKKPRNPEGFSEQSWLNSLGCTGRVTVSRKCDIQRGPLKPLLYTDRMLAWRLHLLGLCSSAIRFGLSHAAGDLLCATLLGQRSPEDSERRRIWQLGGLAHLLALSGLHVGLLTVLAMSVLKLLPLPLPGRHLLLTCVLLAWLWLVGSPASAQRAVFMAILLLGGMCFEREQRGLWTLHLVLFVNLLLSPGELLKPGFQLSYTAVAALLFSLPAKGGPDRPFLSYLLASLKSSLVVSLATAGLVLWHFQYLSLAGILLNLLAIPLCSLILAAGLLHLLPDLPGDPVAQAINHATLLLDSLARLGARPETRITFSLPAPVAVLICMTVLCWLARKSLFPNIRSVLLLPSLLLLPVMAYAGQRFRQNHRVEILALDVEQGDATLLRLGSQSVLVDTGVRNHYQDMGERLEPLLRRCCPGGLDWLVLTHPDGDHIGGALHILRHIRVHNLLTNGEWRDNGLNRELRFLCDSLALDPQTAEPGRTLVSGENLRLQVLGPPLKGLPAGNERSVVLRLQHGNNVALLCADAGFPEERWLLNWDDWLQADLLKLGHHGSAHSSGKGFLRAVSPLDAFYSCGIMNRYGHPAPQTLERCRELGMRLSGTPHSGALWYTSTAKGWQLNNWNKGKEKP